MKTVVSLVHVPRPEFRGEKVESTFIMIMPVGLLGLADVLDRDGHDVEVVHTGLARLRDPSFKLSEYLKTRRPSLVGFTLQWHQQLYNVLEEARLVKDALPEAGILLGGMTASYFARELIERFDFISAVVSGEGEEPLRRIAAGEDIRGIPNVTYRESGVIASNPLGYTASAGDLDGIEFTRMELLRDADLYSCKWRLGGMESAEEYCRQRVFYLCGGRGCSVECSFCGGSNRAHEELSGRQTPILRSPERLLNDSLRAAMAGYDTLYMCFDPPMNEEEHFVRFFDLVAKQEIDISMIFECYALPSEKFLDSFAAAFGRGGSRIALSPDTTDEKARRFFKGYWYSNYELEACLDRCKSRGLETTLFFTLFPMRGWAEEVKRLKEFQARLIAKYGCTVVTRPIEVEPASLWQKDPSRYGLLPGPYDLDYFLERHRRVATPPGDPRVAASVDLPGY